MSDAETGIGWTADALEYSTLLLNETRPDGSGIDEITIEGERTFGRATFHPLWITKRKRV